MATNINQSSINSPLLLFRQTIMRRIVAMMARPVKDHERPMISGPQPKSFGFLAGGNIMGGALDILTWIPRG